jgi:hypothetical protein
MKTKRVFLAVSIAALLVVILLLSLRAYYVTVALVAGALIMGHRELWSLIRRRQMPPVDERVRGNTAKSVRNGFIFFVIAIPFLMLPFAAKLVEAPDTMHVLGGLFVAAGAVYMLSYLFYDRAEPRLGEKSLKVLRLFILLSGISLGAFIVGVFLHNILSGLMGLEEPVFFIISVFIAPAAFVVGIMGSLVIFCKGLFGRVP